MTGLSRRDFLTGLAVTTASASLLDATAAFGQEAEVPSFFALGWEPDLPSLEAEQKYELGFNADLPPKFDLSASPEMPPIYNQGRIGSCVANAVAAAIQFARRQTDKDTDFVPSRLYLYYYARAKLGSVLNDRGSRISDAVQVARDQGVCEEEYWEYDGSEAPGQLFQPTAKAATEPDDACAARAFQYRITEYRSPTKTESNLKGLIASRIPVVFGFTVYSNMYEPNGRPVNTLDLPTSNDTKVGGHAVVLVGYDDETRMFRVRNSWGTSVHDRGYYDMSYDYVLSPLARDFWIVLDTFSGVAPSL